MKTLVLLSALVLLAFQVQAEPTPKTDEGTKTDEQPGKEDEVVSVSVEGQGDPAFQDAVLRGLDCFCRAKSCRWGEGIMGTCNKRFGSLILCCR
ncbi:defensin 5 [Rattus rattus]|uniref:defensin 5 n=1 Tax=Rattus rattus TaxID=10117 RepID=UPI0013F32BAC|nr:defensin 5 [Rattus rattus]